MPEGPSSFRSRIPVAALALCGCAISVYLALFQYGVVHSVWDPIFGDGSRKVLTSAVSRVLPVSDATLGAAAYLVEAVLELSGGRRRWHDRPWIVVLLGLTAAVLALTGVGLVIAQPILTGTFCTLCLTSAGISWLVALLVAREVGAAVRRVRELRDAGLPLPAALRGREPQRFAR
ncbi:vitamin K epoxide reductase family protein [Sphaerisporangium rhizosphaerae]|uniref:Vitamin K epoxide reductase family protein n=1 Tax=Sphaerisporangium rhizosphaerae TaxID=2269375 RepID=A0ABW2PGY3_9ACTN